MSVAALVGSFDDIVRSASVLTEGIEGGRQLSNRHFVTAIFLGHIISFFIIIE